MVIYIKTIVCFVDKDFLKMTCVLGSSKSFCIKTGPKLAQFEKEKPRTFCGSGF